MLKIGDRVKHPFGSGVVVDFIKSDLNGQNIFPIVKCDESPPREYNMGGNPCMFLMEHCKKLKVKHDKQNL